MSGRAKDLDVQTLEKVLDWAVVQNWLKTKPDLTWTKLAKPPKKVRLMTQEELDAFANANMEIASVEEQPEEVRHLWAHQMKRGQAFRDYIYTIFYSGARVKETTMLRWEYVKWSTPTQNGHVFFPGEQGRGLCVCRRKLRMVPCGWPRAILRLCQSVKESLTIYTNDQRELLNAIRKSSQRPAALELVTKTTAGPVGETTVKKSRGQVSAQNIEPPMAEIVKPDWLPKRNVRQSQSQSWRMGI